MPTRHFTLKEIESGIARFRRQITEVTALAAGNVRLDDPRCEALEETIQSTLDEVFGKGSSYSFFIRGSLTPLLIGDESESEQQEAVVEGIGVTVRRLEEAIETLTRERARTMLTTLENLNLHPRIASACIRLYQNGHYRNAVLDAVVVLAQAVKEKSDRYDLDGAGLMSTVFSRNGPILAFNDLKDRSEEDEQEGMMHLFMGAVLALRNPRAHKLLDDSPEEALEYIGLLSLLAKRLEKTWHREV